MGTEPVPRLLELAMDRVEYEPLVIQDLINLKRADELDLNPWYQRRSDWTTPQKAYLINTIFEQKPVPSLYIRHSLDIDHERSIKEIVDGQQRIRSILEYVSDQFPARHPAHEQNVKYSDLTRKEKETFRMTSLSVGYLLGASEVDVIDIFGRLNSVSKTLNLQEKRNARFSGEFKQFCLGQAALRVHLWRDLGIFTANDIARMQEVQFVSELVIGLLHGLTDYSVKAIDEIYARFDAVFDDRAILGDRMEGIFSQVAAVDPSAVRDTIFSRSPLFYTLFLVLATMSKPPSSKALAEGLFHIDKSFNSDTPLPDRPPADADFFVACTSNMHRIKSRKVRDEYVRSRLTH